MSKPCPSAIPALEKDARHDRGEVKGEHVGKALPKRPLTKCNFCTTISSNREIFKASLLSEDRLSVSVGRLFATEAGQVFAWDAGLLLSHETINTGPQALGSSLDPLDA